MIKATKGHFPLITFVSILFTTLVLILGLLCQSWFSHKDSRKIQVYNFQIQRLIGTIIYLDEVLTMSARMGAATGDLKCEKRYLIYEPHLNTAIEEAKRLVSDAFMIESAVQADNANIKLVAMEKRAFDLVREGKKDEAMTLLFSEAYKIQKRIYAEGIKQITAEMQVSGKRFQDKHHQRILQTAIVIAITLPCLIIAWVYVLRSMNMNIRERKNTEARLKYALEQNRIWLEYSPVCTKVIDLDFNLKYMSNAGVEALKIDDITTLYGKPYPFDFYPESSRNLMVKNLDKIKKTGNVITQEISVVDIEGNVIWFNSTLVPINDDKGRIDYIMIVSVDTTEHHNAEQKIKDLNESLEQRVSERTADLARLNEELEIEIIKRTKTEELLKDSFEQTRLWLDNSPVCTKVVDLDFNLKYMSDAGIKSLKIDDVTTLYGKPYPFSFFPESTKRAMNKTLKKVKETGETITGEAPVCDIEGNEAWFQATFVPVKDIEGRIDFIIIVSVDVNDRKLAENEIKVLNEELETKVRDRTSEINKLSHAVEQSASAVMITDVEGNIEYVNSSFTQISGFVPDETIGNNPRILNSGLMKPEFYEEMWRTLLSGIGWKGEIHNKKKSGELYWELASISPIKNKEDVITNFVAVKEDITESKEIEYRLRTASEEAQRASEAKSIFLSSMSHEIRTPMNSILGFAQLLESGQRESLTDSQKDNVTHILESGNHLLDLINEVLDLSSIESGKVQISMENIEVGSAINEVITNVEPMTKKNNVTINYSIECNDQYVKVDRTRLNQILINLLSNAIKYNNVNGSVTISCMSPDDDTVRINIEDTGPGIAKEKHDLLFEPFNRLGAESLNIEGTGVGLTITKRLIEMMGGSIGVESPVLHNTTESEEVGRGARFYVDLKKGYAPESIPDIGEVVAKDNIEMTERHTMLYVEDNPANLKLVESILLRRPGISMLTALQAQSGIELAISHQPDIILMDINLPGMNGYEASKLLKSYDDTKNIPIIAISADAMPEDIERGKSSGFIAYITKPINVSNFLEVVDGVLTNRVPARPDKVVLDGTNDTTLSDS